MPESLFITDLDEIKSLLKTNELIYLYDTVLIAQHEKIFHQTGARLLCDFVKAAPVIITEAVYNELARANSSTIGLSDRYVAYLSQFQQVLYLSESHLFELIRYKYPKGVLPNMLKILKAAFKTRVSFTQYLDSVAISSEEAVLALLHEDFADGKDYGEYSLIWTAFVIQEIYQKMNCHFIGADNDLFRLYMSSYQHDAWTKQKQTMKKAWISSTETILAAMLLDRGDEQMIHVYRHAHVASRKLIYHEYLHGILSLQYASKPFSNMEFIHAIKQKHVHIVY